MEARQHVAAAAAVAVPVETWRRSCPRARMREALRRTSKLQDEVREIRSVAPAFAATFPEVFQVHMLG